MLVVVRMLQWGLVLLVWAVISVEGETQLYHLREAVGLPGSFRYSPDILMCISLRIPFNHVICNFPIDQAFKTRKAASTTSIQKKKKKREVEVNSRVRVG
jgi:hypothetical protein